MTSFRHTPTASSALPLILGTAQLGLSYGIANIAGKPDQEEANAIVRAALDGGVTFFDTAQGYGDSEGVLGAALSHCGASPTARVITKLLPALPKTSAELRDLVAQSMTRLNITRLYCLMLHREDHLPQLDSRVGEMFRELLTQGAITNAGISVYSPEAALSALEHALISIVQIPASLFDRRFESAGVFAAAKAKGKELHVRSIFLQGVLGMRPEQLPSHLHGLAPALDAFGAACARHRCEPMRTALRWGLRRYPDSRIIFGAETAEQVQENLNFITTSNFIDSALWEELETILPPQKDEYLNPALWKAK
jgi:aryl-alcohol dehydrogenase-like predicted oxidoreductase